MSSRVNRRRSATAAWIGISAETAEAREIARLAEVELG
jgi:hypothetical protein